MSSAPGSPHGHANSHGSDRRVARPPPSSFQEKELLPDLGTRRASGRTSLDSRQAFDMKSLGKHIEVGWRVAATECFVVDTQAPGDQPLQLTPKEEMETTLIQSLIASYFGITRQTIQDLVPKAIMHLLVSSLTPCA